MEGTILSAWRELHTIAASRELNLTIRSVWTQSYIVVVSSIKHKIVFVYIGNIIESSDGRNFINTKRSSVKTKLT